MREEDVPLPRLRIPLFRLPPSLLSPRCQHFLSRSAPRRLHFKSPRLSRHDILPPRQAGQTGALQEEFARAQVPQHHRPQRRLSRRRLGSHGR